MSGPFSVSAYADWTALKHGIKNFTVLIELDLLDNNITALPAELVLPSTLHFWYFLSWIYLQILSCSICSGQLQAFELYHSTHWLINNMYWHQVKNTSHGCMVLNLTESFFVDAFLCRDCLSLTCKCWNLTGIRLEGKNVTSICDLIVPMLNKGIWHVAVWCQNYRNTHKRHTMRLRYVINPWY